MSEIQFKNKRFNPDLVEFHALAKQMAKSVGYTAELKLEKNLAQLVRLRVALKNECSYCSILHSKTAREIGIHPAKVDQISSWWESELFSEQEQAALAYTDALCEGGGSGKAKNFQLYHEGLQDYFDEQKIAELAGVIINMTLWTRLKLAQGAVPVMSSEAQVNSK